MKQPPHHPASLVLCPEYFDGRRNGIGRVSEMVVGALESAGSDVAIWSANESKGRDGNRRRFARNYGLMLGAAVARGICGSPSIVACLHLGLSPVARALALRRGGYFVFLHGIEAWQPLRWRAQYGVRGANLLVANSQFTLDQFRQHNPRLANLPAAVVPLGIGDGPTPRPHSAPTPQVLCVTRLSKVDAYKNVRVLISAFASLLTSRPDARLIVVGDGDDRTDLAAYASARLPAASFVFPGSVTDERLAKWRSESALFVLPSEREGFGLVFAEAMAAGLPCICGDRDAAREVVTEETGQAVDPQDAQGLASAMHRILSDDRLRERLGHAAARRYETRFTAAHFKGRLLQALRQHHLLD